MSLRLRIAVALLLITAITAGSVFPQLSPPSKPGTDLWIHAVAYSGLTVIFAALFGFPVVWALLLVLFSALIEGLQSMLPARVASWMDLAANAAGVMAGLALFAALTLAPLWRRGVGWLRASPTCTRDLR